jgi:hypothetical protein
MIAAHKNIETPVRTFGKELGAAVANSVNAGIGSVSNRSALLWWKETLYSPELQKSYRELQPAEAALAMALDLNTMAPAPCPQSVQFFLREAVRAAGKHDTAVSVKELLTVISGSEVLKDFMPTVDVPPRPERVALLRATNIGHHVLQTGDLRHWLGVGGDLTLRVEDFAVWLFRDAQADSLSVSVTRPAQQPGK